MKVTLFLLSQSLFSDFHTVSDEDENIQHGQHCGQHAQGKVVHETKLGFDQSTQGFTYKYYSNISLLGFQNSFNS